MTKKEAAREGDGSAWRLVPPLLRYRAGLYPGWLRCSGNAESGFGSTFSDGAQGEGISIPGTTSADERHAAAGEHRSDVSLRPAGPSYRHSSPADEIKRR